MPDDFHHVNITASHVTDEANNVNVMGLWHQRHEQFYHMLLIAMLLPPAYARYDTRR